MSLCPECGNEVALATLAAVNANCGPVCLVCQHTGRAAHIVLEPKPAQQPEEVQMRGLAAALDATYRALAAEPLTEDVEAKMTVIEAQQMLRHRIRNPEHNRERPDWVFDEDEEQKEREEVCQTCKGTRRYLTLPCPDCSEDGDRERD